jgi:hypothetical protein
MEWMLLGIIAIVGWLYLRKRGRNHETVAALGSLAKKPSAQEQHEYGRRAMQASQVCMYLFQHHACPPPDGMEKVDLNLEENRQSLAGAVVTLVHSLRLESLSSEQKAQAIVTMAQNLSLRADRLSRSENDAIMLVTVINVIDMTARHYYELYPNYQPLHELVNQMAKVCPSGLAVVFGDDLPIEVRRAFPHFSSLVEHNRANF